MLQQSFNSADYQNIVDKRKLIVVTGFGPFIGHETKNASWEAVQLLPNTLEVNGQEFIVEKKLVSVIYEEVDAAIDEIWSKNPHLVIHCGVHGGTQCIRVEKLAYNNKFNRPDYAGKKLCNSSTCINASNEFGDKLHTQFDVTEIVKNVSSACSSKDIIRSSDDVGNYLCGYIYLKSLDRDSARSLFIHVPPIDNPLTSEETAERILNVIVECISQITGKLISSQESSLRLESSTKHC